MTAPSTKVGVALSPNIVLDLWREAWRLRPDGNMHTVDAFAQLVAEHALRRAAANPNWTDPSGGRYCSQHRLRELATAYGRRARRAR